jgi:hypothetical protein
MSPQPYPPADRWTTLKHTENIYAALGGKKEIWWLEGITRRFEAYNHVGEHPERLLEFVKKHFEPAG